VPNRPVNFALSYAAGPLVAGFGYERTGAEAAETAKWTTFNLSYNFGSFKLGGLYGTGDTAAGAEHQSYLLTATAPIGAGEFRFSYGQLKNKTADVTAAKGFGIGYHYSLSKRTTLYGDISRNNADVISGSQTGYDIGIKHNF
jgi:predicted porin